MRFLFMIITLLIILASCETSRDSVIIKEPIITEPTQYMSAEEVRHAFISAEQKDSPRTFFMEEPLTDEEVERKKWLKKDDEFFPAEIRKTLNKPKSRTLEIKELDFDDVDLRKWDTPIKKQWNGTCTTFAGVAAIENKIRKPLSVDLSERDSWNWYKKYSCNAFIKSLKKNRICDESNWPQDRTRSYSSCKENRHAGLVSTTYLGDSVEKSIESLQRGNPVYIGMSTPNDMLRGLTVIRPDSSKSGGGHALEIVGARADRSVKGGGYWILKNSWGAHIGDKGYQYLPFHYCSRSDTYCAMWEISEIKHGSSKPWPSYTIPRRIKECWGWWIFRRCRFVGEGEDS